jgi:hypothetical protein
MNLLVLSCKTMRDGLIVSGFFLVTALCLLLAGRFLIPPVYLLPQITFGLAVLLLIFSPIILISTYLARVHIQRKKPM